MDSSDLNPNDNPLLEATGLPRFDRIRAEHVVPAVERVVGKMERGLNLLETNLEPTWDGLMKPLDKLRRPLEYAWKPVVHLLNVKNSDELRKAHETVLEDVVAVNLRLRQSRPIYDALKSLRQSKAWDNLSGPRQRIVEWKLLKAEHSGAALEGSDRERLMEIEKELSQKGTDFSNNVLDATKRYELIITEKKDTEGWPETLKQLTADSYNKANPTRDRKAIPGKGPWRITLDLPCFVSFLQHGRLRRQREQVYRAFVRRASEGKEDNTDLLCQILSLRKEKAKLLGFDSYARLSLASKMAGKVDAVEEMFEQLQAAAKPHALGDLQDLKQVAAETGQSAPLSHWDIHFWAERLRERRLGYSDEDLRPYFPLPKVLDGLFNLSRKLFGIVIRPADGEAPVWHLDVRYFKVYEETGEQIASFYLDPYSRPGEKRGGAWMDSCLDRRRLEGRLRLPVVHLCCNSAPPVGGRPSLMSFSEVKTLFHEFGHGLQGMLTTVDFADVAGTRGIEWDAVEVASQFMENWCYHRPTLKGMSAHVETGEPLPEGLLDRISAAREFRAGAMMMRQLELGMTDMELHHRFEPGGSESAFEVHHRISEQTGLLPPLGDDRFLCAFLHIFAGPYAAGYYSYKWAEVLSADIFAAFEEAGLDNEQSAAEMGRRFRRTVLASGGGRHPMAVFRDFRGREPRIDALLRQSGLG